MLVGLKDNFESQVTSLYLAILVQRISRPKRVICPKFFYLMVGSVKIKNDFDFDVAHFTLFIILFGVNVTSRFAKPFVESIGSAAENSRIAQSTKRRDILSAENSTELSFV